MKVKIIGYERNKGFSQKKNADYDWHILHTQDLKPLAAPASGFRVERVLISGSSGILAAPPKAGETWELVYNRFGRVEEAFKLLVP